MGDRSSPTTSEYAVRIPASFITSMRESSAVQQTPLRNLHKDFLDLNEEMQVYVRIKPSKDDNSILSISGSHIMVQPSKDSVSFKNRTNGGSKTLQKFKFNKIYDSSTSQQQLFKDSALNLVQDFLMGQNTLLFTYGATSAGKTYTMLGSVRDAGLLPRSLDVLFNSLEDRLLDSPLLKPLALNEVMKLTPQQTDAEELERSMLMRGFDLDISDSKDSISTVSSSSLKDWNIRAKDTTVCTLQYPNNYFAVWVSYCEIYNEQVFDLLDVCDRRKKRVPLRVTEDRKGKFYVKGLKEICVHSADDAVRVLLFGKENLHFAATKLNHNSSRSHCVFTVKIIRTNHREEPSEAAVNMMSFCDLAGMERTTKTQSRGERLKEAGNINTSLLILGRCIDAMRMNQNNPASKMIIPYRESKLTRILQTFFSGQGRAAMFVNVSPSPLLCDETLHVLKFGALAQEVVIQPDRDASMADYSISQFAPPIRPSRFQQYVRKSISILSARASVMEPSFQVIGEDDEEAQDRINALEVEVAQLKMDLEANEQKIRDECCNEWSAVVMKMESSWKQRYEDTKARYEEFCENRVNLMTNLMNNCMKKRKVSDGEDLEDIVAQLKDKDDQIDTLEDNNRHLTEVLEKLKIRLKASEDGKAELQKEMTRLQFEAASQSKPRINFCGTELVDEDEVIAADNSRELVVQLQKKLETKEEMLNEAVIEFHNKNEQVTKLLLENDALKKQLAQSSSEISNYQSQLEKSNLLLSDANERLDVREEELMNLEEKLMKANGQYGNLNTELREAKRKIRELEGRTKDQNNVSMVQNMCEELQKQLLESESLLEKRREEIEHLNEQVSNYRKRMDSTDQTTEELEQMQDRYTKLQIQLSIVNKEMTSLKVANEDLKTQTENLLDEVSHLKKDLELSSSERRQEEGNLSELIKDNERLRLSNSDLNEIKVRLTSENKEFQTTLTEFESTVQELTAQLEHMRTQQRDHSLVEEELSTLAATLGRVQVEKNQIEKELINQKFSAEKLQTSLENLRDEKAQIQAELEACQQCKNALESHLQQIKDEMKSSTEDSVDSVSALEKKLEDMKIDLMKSKKRVTELEGVSSEKVKTEKDFKDKFDQLEGDHEKLTKEMLKHMRRADQLSETVNSLKEELNAKVQKYDALNCKMRELEAQNQQYGTVQSQLVEKELEIRENQNHIASILSALEEKDSLIKQLNLQKEELERSINEKNTDILRLETELKSMLSGHVNFKKANKPAIKVERHEEDQLPEEEVCSAMATPTPARARRGRAKKVVSPCSVQKETDGEEHPVKVEVGSTRSRRTLKTEFASAPAPTPAKASGRKSRKPKNDEDVAHPALSANIQSSTEDFEGVHEQISTGNTKRKLYNSKFPEILLPSSKEELDGEHPKRMTTRASRKQ